MVVKDCCDFCGAVGDSLRVFLLLLNCFGKRFEDNSGGSLRRWV